MVAKINGYIFQFENDDLLEKCNTIWDKVSGDIKKGFVSELVYNKKLQIDWDFDDKEMPREVYNHICLAIIIAWILPLKKWKLLPSNVLKRMRIHWKTSI